MRRPAAQCNWPFEDFIAKRRESAVVQLLLEPILALHETGDNIAYHIVAGGVDHGCGGIHQIADGHQNGKGQFHLGGEEDGADDVLADVAAAGNAAHAHGGQNGHQHDEGQAGSAELLTEHTQHESNLQHAGEAGAVHVHGSAQRHDHAGHVFVDAGLVGFLQISGDGSHRGAGTQRHHSGTGNMFEHDAHSAPLPPPNHANRGKAVKI